LFDSWFDPIASAMAAEPSDQGHKQHRTARSGAAVKKKQRSEQKKKKKQKQKQPPSRADGESQKNPKVSCSFFCHRSFLVCMRTERALVVCEGERDL
jgi:hypothetical protein